MEPISGSSSKPLAPARNELETPHVGRLNPYGAASAPAEGIKIADRAVGSGRALSKLEEIRQLSVRPD
jgi:hypothetical protein